jgi:NIMA (never in mitosis gene a)-related kinase
MLAQLSHPNVVGYVDSFFHANYLCIVTEYCQGGDMYNRLKACKTHIPEEQVLDWLVQTARALAHLHGKRIMHRDLKTQNIFLTKDGVVRLGDFGIARALNAATEMAVTVVGTPFYMSPELMASKPYDFKTDMWSLGCVLYEMTSLQHAFCADDMSGLVLKILRGAYDPPPACYSQGLRDLVGKLLSKEPDARPDAETLLADPLLAPRVAAASAAFDAESAMHVKTMDDLRLLAAIPPGGRGAAAGLRAPRRSGVSPPHRVSVPGAPAPPLAPEAAAELGRIKARIARDRDERRALEANIRALEGEAARLRSSGGADVSPPRRVSVAAPPAPPRQPSPPVAAASAAERVAAARKAYAAPGRISQAGAPAARVSQAGSPPRVSVSAQAPQRPAGALHGGIPVAPVPAPAAAAGGPASQALLDQIAAEREELRLARLQLEERDAAAEAKAEAAEAAAKATAAAQAAAPAAEPKSRSASPPQRVASLERARALALAEDAVGSSVPDDDDYRVACEEAKDRVGDFSDDLGGPAPMPRARRGSSGDAAFGGAAAVVPEVRAAGAPRASAGGAARLPRRSSVEAFLERRARASAAGTGDDVAAAPSAPTLPVPPPRPPTAEEVARSRRASEPGPAARTASPPAARAAAAAARAAAHPGAGSAALAALRAARREGDDDSYSREASPPAPRMSSPQRTPGLPPRAAPPAARVSEAGCGASELMRLRDMHASISRRLKAMRAVVRDAAPDAPADPDDAIEEEDAEVEDDDDEGGPAASFDDSGDGDAAQADAPAADAKARPALGAKFGAATLLRRDVFTEGSTAVARAAALRAACDEGLGGPLFVRVYDAVAAQSRGAGASAADDAAFRARLRAELGPDREHFLGLVDRLLFEEEQAFS